MLKYVKGDYETVPAKNSALEALFERFQKEVFVISHSEVTFVDTEKEVLDPCSTIRHGETIKTIDDSCIDVAEIRFSATEKMEVTYYDETKAEPQKAVLLAGFDGVRWYYEDVEETSEAKGLWGVYRGCTKMEFVGEAASLHKCLQY